MEEHKRKAYLHILYYVFIEVRQLSQLSFSLWNPLVWARMYQNLKRVNQIADVFHNLPELIYKENFNEDLFWDSLSKTFPEKVEYYMEAFDEVILEYFPHFIDYLEPWVEVKQETGTTLVREFMKELQERDPLYFTRLYVLARRIDNDDVLFRVIEDNEEYFVVAHLTRNNTLPRIRKFTSIDEWKEQCMFKDHEEYS